MDTVSVLYCLLECDGKTNDMLMNLQEKIAEEYKDKEIYQAFVYGKKTVNAKEYELYKPGFYTMVDMPATREEKEEYTYEKFEALLLAYTLLKKRIKQLITDMQDEEMRLILITSRRRLPAGKTIFKKICSFLANEITDWEEEWEEAGMEITLDVYRFTQDAENLILYDLKESSIESGTKNI